MNQLSNAPDKKSARRKITAVFFFFFLSVTAFGQITWNCAVQKAGFFPRTGFGFAVFDNKLWILNGTTSVHKRDIWSSPDGTNWTKVIDSVPYCMSWDLPVVAFNNSLWILGGRAGC